MKYFTSSMTTLPFTNISAKHLASYAPYSTSLFGPLFSIISESCLHAVIYLCKHTNELISYHMMCSGEYLYTIYMYISNTGIICLIDTLYRTFLYRKISITIKYRADIKRYQLIIWYFHFLYWSFDYYTLF